MTVSSATNTVTYQCNGVTKRFPLTYRFFDNRDIRARLAHRATGESRVLALGIDYFLYGAKEPERNGQAPGYLELMIAAPSSDYEIIIQRVMAITQPTDIINQGRFYPEVHELVFDRLTMMMQQAIYSADRGLRIPDYEDPVSSLPPIPQRADKLLSFDSAGNPIAVLPHPDSSTALRTDLASPEKGSNIVEHILGRPHTFSRTVGSALRDNPNILDYLDRAERADAQTGNPEFDASGAFNKAILDGGQVDIAAGVYGIADTVRARYDTALVGPETGRGTPWGKGVTLKWIGGVEPRKTMFLAGANDVGEDPIQEMAAVTAKNIFFDGDNKVGFLVYSTYLSNESVLKNLKGKGSTEYNFYIAKSWYATIEDITSYAAKNNGIAIGMPLRYADGTIGSAAWSSTIEVNQVNISKLRAHSSGQRFSADAPGTWRYSDDSMLRQGYGIGIGIGHGLSARDLISERSGGVNFYFYTDFKPNKCISDCYAELPNWNNGVDHTDWANVLIEATTTTGGEYCLRDFHLNESSGGIFTIGSPRTITLERVRGAEFLRSLEPDGNVLRSPNFPLRFVNLESCDWRMGLYSVRGSQPWHYAVDLNMSTTDWVIDVPRTPFRSGGIYLVWVKPDTGWGGAGGSGNASTEFWNGDYGNLPLPADLTVGQWNLVLATNLNLKRIRRGSTVGTGSCEIAIQIAKQNNLGAF